MLVQPPRQPSVYQREELTMHINWTDLTTDQQRAMLELWRGTSEQLSRETTEQLRNLGLVEPQARRFAISAIGRTLVPLHFLEA